MAAQEKGSLPEHAKPAPDRNTAASDAMMSRSSGTAAGSNLSPPRKAPRNGASPNLVLRDRHELGDGKTSKSRGPEESSAESRSRHGASRSNHAESNVDAATGAGNRVSHWSVELGLFICCGGTAQLLHIMDSHV